MTTANLIKRLEALQDSQGGDCRIAYVRGLGRGRTALQQIPGGWESHAADDRHRCKSVAGCHRWRDRQGDDGPGCQGRAPHSRPGQDPMGSTPASRPLRVEGASAGSGCLNLQENALATNTSIRTRLEKLEAASDDMLVVYEMADGTPEEVIDQFLTRLCPGLLVACAKIGIRRFVLTLWTIRLPH